jgi:hypothetical protein
VCEWVIEFTPAVLPVGKFKNLFHLESLFPIPYYEIDIRSSESRSSQELERYTVHDCETINTCSQPVKK